MRRKDIMAQLPRVAEQALRYARLLECPEDRGLAAEAKCNFEWTLRALGYEIPIAKETK